MKDKFNTAVSVMLVGPATASTWLADKWGEQRAVRAGHVTRLADDMTKGRFRLSPDAILRVKGKLANGQHRLEAVVKSQMPQHFLVMESDDEQLYKVLDAGVRRTLGDSLIGLSYSTSLPSAAQWVLGYKAGSGFTAARDANSLRIQGFKNARTTNDSRWEVIDFCERNSNALAEAIAYATNLYGKSRLLSVSIGAALYYLAAEIDKRAEAADFLKQVYENAENTAAMDLRSRLILNKGATAKLPQGMVFALALRAFRSFLNGTRPGKLTWERGEPFPRIADEK
jgi:hypothetical protein